MSPALAFRKLITTASLGVVLAATIVSCGAEAPILKSTMHPVTPTRSLTPAPPSIPQQSGLLSDPAPDFKTTAERTSPGELTVTTYGSSSCRPTVKKVEKLPETTAINTVLLTLNNEAKGPCTADLAPTELKVALPQNAPQGSFTLKITAEGGNYFEEISVK